MLALAALHAVAAPAAIGIAHGHHRWLAAHHLWSMIVLGLVSIVPLAAIPAFLTNAMTIWNTLVYALHPIETLAAAWSYLDPSPLIEAGLTRAVGWFTVALWISIRLLIRGLRWAEGAPVH